ncbi:MAG: alpha/beta hydrolase [Clostridia bacterium]|nr:alpha/beta hydrolase [Clostridia bacterium]
MKQKKRNDKRAIKALLKIGPPVNGFYKDDKMLLQRNYLNKMGGILYGKYGNSVINTLPKIPCMFKEYSFFTMLKYVIANEWCLSQPLGQEKVDFLNEVKELAVPVYLFMGKYDYNTVSELAKKWLENLEAPHKAFFEFEKSGHTPQWEEAEKFNYLFSKQVLKIK